MRCLTLMPMEWQCAAGREKAALFKALLLKRHWQPVRRLRARCLTLMPMERQCTAARGKAALFKVDAHEVALAAREEAGSALFNAYAHEVAGHGSLREGCGCGCP